MSRTTASVAVAAASALLASLLAAGPAVAGSTPPPDAVSSATVATAAPTSEPGVPDPTDAPTEVPAPAPSEGPAPAPTEAPAPAPAPAPAEAPAPAATEPPLAPSAPAPTGDQFLMVAPPMPPQTYNGEVRGLVGAWGGFANGRIPLSEMCSASWASRHLFRCDADQALEDLNWAYRATFGVNLTITSSYRTYDEQVALKAAKPTLAATPGTSNHGWGLAVDLGGGVQTFGSAQHNWLRANANSFGWFHPSWAQYDGSLPEPWHWEYAGAVASGNLDQNRTMTLELVKGAPWNSAAERECLVRMWSATSGWDHRFVGEGARRGIAGTDMLAAFGSSWTTSSSAAAFLANPKLQVERGLWEITEWYGGACRAERGDPLPRFASPAASASSVGLGQTVTVRTRAVQDVDWVLEVRDTRTDIMIRRFTGRAADGTDITVRWATDNLQARKVGPGPYRLRLTGVDVADGEVARPFVADVEVTGSQNPPTVAAVPLVGDLRFVPVDPVRILDTRPGAESIGPVSRLDLVVAGANGVPADARAVALNVTATVPSGVSHLRVWPAGRPMPNASVLNVDRQRTASAAGVAVGVGGEGKVSIYNDAGSAHLVVDVTGYWTTAPTAAAYTPLGEAVRVLDTRTAGPAPVPGAHRTVQVGGQGGVPADATAVVVNVVSVASGGDGYVAVVPHGARATTSTVNHLPGTDVANRATVALSGGRLDVHAAGATGDVVVDVVGWYGPSGSTVFTPVQPVRVADTRESGPMGQAETRRLFVGGPARLPGDARAITGTLTAFGQTATATYVTAWPGAGPMPRTSDLNTGRGRDQANNVLTPLGIWGAVDVYNNTGTTQLLLDVTGYFRDRP